jgi:hypothetical protein
MDNSASNVAVGSTSTTVEDRTVSLSSLGDITGALTIRIYGYNAANSGAPGQWALLNYTADTPA